MFMTELLLLIIYLLLLIAALVICWFVAKEFHHIAEMKGHPQKKYFWWCFWTGIFGCAMVIALPDFSSTQKKVADTDELPEL